MQMTLPGNLLVSMDPRCLLLGGFWNSLDDVGSVFNALWLLVEDFNTVLSQMDKIEGRSVASSSSGRLSGLIASFGLIDIGFNSCPYTWSTGR